MTARCTAFARPILFFLMISVFLGGCVLNPATGKRELILISQDEEIAMGDEAAPKFEKEFGGKVPNAELQSYIRAVGGRVAAVSDREMPYEYTLLASKVANAFALPGGKIYITAGLVTLMDNERQLAAVLGHETGHVASLHNVKAIQQQMGASIFSDVLGKVVSGDKGEAAKAGGKIAGVMITLKYSRKYEYQADKFGIRYMTKAGYNPWGMVELLTVLYNLSESEPGSLAEMFQTHPLTSKRISEAKEIIEDDHETASPTAPDMNAAQFLKMRSLLRAAVPGLRK